MPITKDTIWIKLKRYLTETEQEEVRANPELQAQMQLITAQIIKADTLGGAKTMIGERFYFVKLLQLFPEAYKRYVQVREFKDNQKLLLEMSHKVRS